MEYNQHKYYVKIITLQYERLAKVIVSLERMQRIKEILIRLVCAKGFVPRVIVNIILKNIMVFQVRLLQ